MFFPLRKGFYDEAIEEASTQTQYENRPDEDSEQNDQVSIFEAGQKFSTLFQF